MTEKDIKIEDEETLNEEPVEETDKEAEPEEEKNSQQLNIIVLRKFKIKMKIIGILS